jgi:hypothetical protein
MLGVTILSYLPNMLKETGIVRKRANQLIKKRLNEMPNLK